MIFLLKKIIKGLIVFAVFFSIMFMISTNYYIVSPGSTEPLSELVFVEGTNNTSEGEFYLTTVNQTRANIISWLYGYFNPYVELVERENVIPEDIEIEDYREKMNRYMQDSINISQVVALKRAGYEIQVESEGIEVVEIPDSSPARGILEEGDLIIEIDGSKIPVAEEMVENIRERQIGEPVDLTIERNGKQHELTVETVESSDEPGSGALEIYIITSGWSPVFPLEINIDSGDIGGPSAGLMFVLEIKNQLTEYDLTAGEKIAGTGTINMDEEIGSVGGVRHKMVAAEGAGIRYFFVPKDNAWIAEYVEGYYDDFDAVIVETLDDALDFLKKLRQEEITT